MNVSIILYPLLLLFVCNIGGILADSSSNSTGTAYLRLARCNDPSVVCVYVNGSNNVVDDSLKNGFNWTSSFTTINNAITVARNYPNSWIVVADGIYEEVLVWQGVNVSLISMNLGSSFVTLTCSLKGKGIRGPAITIIQPAVTYGSIFQGLTITNCSSSSGGGIAMFGIQSSPTVIDLNITNNIGIVGGGIYISEGNPIFINTSVTNNAGREGGGLFSIASTQPTQFYGCTFDRNTAANGFGIGGSILLRDTQAKFYQVRITNGVAGQAGAVYIDGSKASFSQCTITSNSGLSDDGGAIMVIRSEFEMYDSMVSQNKGGARGGAIAFSAPYVQVSKSDGSPNPVQWRIMRTTFVSNVAASYGGAVNMNSGVTSVVAIVDSCIFNKNTGRAGGGLAIFFTTTNVTNSQFLSNTAGTINSNPINFGGGGIFVQNSINTQIQNCNFNGNLAPQGGGVDVTSGSTVTIQNSYMNNNKASWGAGLNCGGTVKCTVNNCTIINNNAVYHGGGIGVWNLGKFFITSSWIGSNSAYFGAGMYIESYSQLSVDTNTFTGNIATMGGGGIFFLTGNPPIISSTTNRFNTNIATYGENMASVPNKLLLLNATSIFNIPTNTKPSSSEIATYLTQNRLQDMILNTSIINTYNLMSTPILIIVVDAFSQMATVAPTSTASVAMSMDILNTSSSSSSSYVQPTIVRSGQISSTTGLSDSWSIFPLSIIGTLGAYYTIEFDVPQFTLNIPIYPLQLTTSSIQSSKIIVRINHCKPEDVETYYPPGTTDYKICSQRIPLNQFKTSLDAELVVYILSACMMTMIILLCIFIIKHRYHNVFKASSVQFCVGNLVFSALLCMGTIFYAQSPSRGSYVCYLRPWFTALPLVGMLACLLTKANRIQYIFNRTKLSVPSYTNGKIITQITIIVSIQIILLIGLTGADLSAPAIIIGTGNTRGYMVNVCNSVESTSFVVWLIIQLTYIIGIIAVGGNISWKVRNVPSEFNESSHIMNCIYILTFYLIVLLPLNFIVDDNPNALILIRGVGQNILALSLVLCLFAPKVYYFLIDYKDTSNNNNHTVISNIKGGSAERGTTGGAQHRYVVKKKFLG